MDAQAIDLEVLSINPYWYNREARSGRSDREDPERKAGGTLRLKARPVRSLCSLTLQAPDLAVQELETAVKKQG